MEITIMHVSGWLTIGGFIACLYLLSWQLRIKPCDRQSWAAMFFLLSLSLILAQLALAYLGGPPLGDSWRGNVSFFLVMISLIGLAIETRRVNLGILSGKNPERCC